MAKPIHSMIRVLDEARSVGFYTHAFDLSVSGYFVFETFTLVYMRDGGGDFELEMTINHGRTEPYNVGDGYGHLAFSVDDLDAEHRRLQEAGYAPTPIKHLLHEGKALAGFFFVVDPDGYKIEVLQRGGRYM